jgi:hypothetical protein
VDIFTSPTSKLLWRGDLLLGCENKGGMRSGVEPKEYGGELYDFVEDFFWDPQESDPIYGDGFEYKFH